MILHGREVKFRRTVLGNCEIAEMSPKKDINRFDELLKGDYMTSQNAAAKFMVALSKGYEMNQRFENPDYEMNPLTVEEALLLDGDDFNELFTEALTAFTGDKPTVEAEPVKEKGKNAEGDSE